MPPTPQSPSPLVRLQRLGRQVRTLAPILADTARLTAGEAVRRVVPGGASAVASVSADVDLPAPDGVADYARQVSAQRLVAAAPQGCFSTWRRRQRPRSTEQRWKRASLESLRLVGNPGV